MKNESALEKLKKAQKYDSKEGQGFNDARGEIPDKEDTPKKNGQNINNDPAQADRPRPGQHRKP